MKQKEKKQINFIFALSICFTSIVGIGIFLKNAAIGKNVLGNGYAWLSTWIITGIIAMLLAFHYGKISRIESKKGLTGISGWTDEIINKKNHWFKKIVLTNYGVFYNPILSICLSFFTAEFFIEFLKTINPNIKLHLGIYAIISLCFLAFFVLNNYFSARFSGYISLSSTILKLIPLFLAIVIGIGFWQNHNFVPTNPKLDKVTSNGFDIPINFSQAIRGIMISIPGVMFAFDSFAGVGSWSKKIKGGSKAVSKVIITAVAFVIIIYSLISIASILHFNDEGTTILNVLIDALPVEFKRGITIFISLFIFISAFGTSNSIIGTSVNEFNNIINYESVVGARWLKLRFGEKKASLVFLIIILSIWCLILFIPSIIINNDAIIDGLSNIVVVAFFLVYALIIFLYWKNIYSPQQESKKITSYTVLTWITCFAVFFVTILNLYFVIDDAIRWNEENKSWGLFLKDKITLNNLSVLLINISFLTLFFTLPFINYKFLKNKF